MFVMPRSKRVSIRLRGIESAFSRIFGPTTIPPIGRLKLTRRGSGYFGNWRGEKPREGRELVFNLSALPEHGELPAPEGAGVLGCIMNTG
jgi:hypothetical protein